MAEGKRRLYTKKREDSRAQAKTAGRNAHNAVTYTAQYKVQRSDTLLEFLLKKCNQSRNNVKSLLSGGKVLVNGRAEKQFDFPLAKDDEVKIAKNAAAGLNALRAETVAPKNGKTGEKNARQKSAATPQNRVAKPTLPKIIYEDEEFLAIDKPAGLLSVESDKERLSAYYLAEEYLRQSGRNARAYVLHRIDKETSGVLVFAKDIKIHSMLKMHWNELVKTREYYAVTEGVPEERSVEIVSYLKEDKNHLVYCVSPKEGKRAVTRYETIRENGNFSLLRVEIDSGRKNQIRVAMKEIGHPIVGDEKYGLIDSPLNRLGLHASRLVFTHPVSKKEIAFSAPVPSEFFGLFSADSALGKRIKNR